MQTFIEPTPLLRSTLDARTTYVPELHQQGLGWAFVVPLVMAAVGAVISTGGAVVAGQRRTNSQLKIMSTTATNEIERTLAENRNWFKNLNNPTVAEKQAAVDFFNAQWSTWANQMAQLGEPGQRAVRERQRGGVNSWGDDWWELYLDPILEVKTVEEKAITANPNGPTISSEVIGGLNPNALGILAVVGVGWYLLSGKGGR